MFGYVKVDKPEMKIKDYEIYRGLYCSLCKAMIKHYGPLSSLTLSYDVTFLILMRLGFFARLLNFKKGRCPYSLAKRCNFCVSSDEELRYAASISMMLFYFKVKDNIADSSVTKRLGMYLILPWAALKYRKAKRLYPEIAEEISQCMARQTENEKSKTELSDKAAHESADALGKIFAFGMKENADEIYRFGYGIGKWVYLMDAADDMERDIKDKSYNVFVLKYAIENVGDITDSIREEILGTLNLSCVIACEAYDKIEDKTLKPIAENILFMGMKNAMEKIFSKGKSEK